MTQLTCGKSADIRAGGHIVSTEVQSEVEIHVHRMRRRAPIAIFKSYLFVSRLSSPRVTPPNPRPGGRGPRLFFDFLGRESTLDAKKGEKGPRVGRV